MGDYYSHKKDNSISFKQIAMLHFQKIMDLSCSEFTGGYWNYIYSGNVTNKSYIGDKRAEYSQAVESLSYALSPFFDADMKTAYETHEKAEEELKKKFIDDDGLIKTDNNGKIKYSVQKLELMKKLFLSLSCLMHRLDYFKAEVYTEGDDDEGWDEDDDDD